MTYEKQTWATEDVVTADKLNHMEDGIAVGSDLKVAYITVKRGNSLENFGSLGVFVGYASLEEHDDKTFWNIYPFNEVNFIVFIEQLSIYRSYELLSQKENVILCFALYDDGLLGVDIEGDAELSEIKGAVQNYPYDSWISGDWKIYEITGDCDFTLKYLN